MAFLYGLMSNVVVHHGDIYYAFIDILIRNIAGILDFKILAYLSTLDGRTNFYHKKHYVCLIS